MLSSPIQNIHGSESGEPSQLPGQASCQPAAVKGPANKNGWLVHAIGDRVIDGKAQEYCFHDSQTIASKSNSTISSKADDFNACHGGMVALTVLQYCADQ